MRQSILELNPLSPLLPVELPFTSAQAAEVGMPRSVLTRMHRDGLVKRVLRGVYIAAATPDCLSTATFYPEPGAADYVAAAIRGGVRVFKAHIQVGDYDPNDPLLDDVWGAIADADVPVVIHCGSGPAGGRFTGSGPIRRLLRRHPRLALVIAHMGMPEYREFLDICLDSATVHLDTTMAFTEFMNQTTPFPASEQQRLLDAGDRILFGSDFPNIPYGYRDALTAITELPGVDGDWLGRVFYRNAARMFAIEDEPTG